MSSAILCSDPGKCGELLMAFPMSSVSTSTTTETMRMQLRCYLGACLYDPEKVIVVPDIQFECVVSDTLVNQNPGITDGESAYYDGDGVYHPNTGPLGWLDYESCSRVHGTAGDDDDVRRDEHHKRIMASTKGALTGQAAPLAAATETRDATASDEIVDEGSVEVPESNSTEASLETRTTAANFSDRGLNLEVKPKAKKARKEK